MDGYLFPSHRRPAPLALRQPNQSAERVVSRPQSHDAHSRLGREGAGSCPQRSTPQSSNTRVPNTGYLLAPPPFPSFFELPARNPATSKLAPPAGPAPPPKRLLTGLLFWRSSSSARISGSTTAGQSSDNKPRGKDPGGNVYFSPSPLPCPFLPRRASPSGLKTHYCQPDTA